MKRIVRKPTLLSLCAAGLLVALLLGGGSSLSGGLAIRGDVTHFGGADAMPIRELPGSGVGRIVALIATGLVPLAQADERVREGIEVCIEGRCTFTDENGDFELDLTGLSAGIYIITFSRDDDTYSAKIGVVDDAIIMLEGVSVSEDGDLIYIDMADDSIPPTSVF